MRGMMNEWKEKLRWLIVCLFIDTEQDVRVKLVSLFEKIDEYWKRWMWCLAAAANNNICNVGVAYNARIGGKWISHGFSSRKCSGNCDDQLTWRHSIMGFSAWRYSSFGWRSDGSSRIDGIEFSSGLYWYLFSELVSKVNFCKRRGLLTKEIDSGDRMMMEKQLMDLQH